MFIFDKIVHFFSSRLQWITRKFQESSFTSLKEKIMEILRDVFYFLKDTKDGFISFFNKENFIKNLRTLRWNKLDSYIMTQFFQALIGAVVLFVSIYEMAQIFQDMRGLPDDVNKEMLTLHYWATVPYWTFILQPFGFLFATVFVLSKLAASREMVAMVSSGTSVFRLSFYMMLFSTLYYLSIVGFLMNNFILPTYQKSFIYRRVALNQATLGELDWLKNNSNFTIFGADNLLYLGEFYDATQRFIDKATIVQYADPEQVKTTPFLPVDENTEWIFTNRMLWESLKELRVDDRMSFVMRVDAERLYWSEKDHAWAVSNGTIRTISDGGKRFETRKVDYEVLSNLVDPYWFFERNWYPIEAMTIDEGLRHIYKLKQSGRSYHADLTKYYAKDAYPLGLIFVVMVGIGIVNMASKTVSVPINSAISMAIFIVYYLMYTSFLGLAGRGDVTPWVGGFAGSIIFGILAFILYARTTT